MRVDFSRRRGVLHIGERGKKVIVNPPPRASVLDISEEFAQGPQV